MKKAKIDETVIFTVRDALRYSSVFQTVIKSRPDFEYKHAEHLKASYSIIRVLNVKLDALSTLKMLIMEDVNLLGQFKQLPDFVLSSLPTMDLILQDPTILDLVYTGKLSFEGLVRLCEKGSL